MQRLTRQVLGSADDVVNRLVEQSEEQTDVVAALLAQARHEGEDA
ncbi:MULTISPECIES: hypothetical protein [unclassified Streptomyces]|nr:hypothetical protein [Streptomyces sp. SAT1]